MTLGEVLRDARGRAKLSLRDVEREVGVSNGHLSLVESGAVRSPSPNILDALARLYGVSYALLMELAGYRAPAKADAGDLADSELSDLSQVELEEVRRFVGYLRSSRSGHDPRSARSDES